MRTTVRALVAAARQWRAVPQAAVFDSGASFQGRLLVACRQHAGSRLSHAAVNHPQPAGPRERAFRGGLEDVYRQYDEGRREPLRSHPPGYVQSRHPGRGHRAAGGKPPVPRLHERDRWAAQELRERLESVAWHEVKRKVVARYGAIQVFGRLAQAGSARKEREGTLIATVEGLEAHAAGRCVAVRRDDWKYRKRPPWEGRTIPPRS